MLLKEIGEIDLVSESSFMDDLGTNFFFVLFIRVDEIKSVAGLDGEMFLLDTDILSVCIVIVIIGESVKITSSLDIFGGNRIGAFNPGLGRSFGRGGNRRSFLSSIFVPYFKISNNKIEHGTFQYVLKRHRTYYHVETSDFKFVTKSIIQPAKNTLSCSIFY